MKKKSRDRRGGKKRDRGRDTVYQFKVTLLRTKPLIWRRLLVPADATLRDLHVVIQIAMPWDGGHLHEFQIRGGRFGQVEYSGVESGLAPVIEESGVRLAALLLTKGVRFTYWYDFGDDWMHELELEAVLPADPDKRYPVCTKAVRAAPPDDCGGVWGYYYMLEALADPEHQDHARYVEWMGDDADWDPEHVDLDAINKRLELLADGADDLFW